VNSSGFSLEAFGVSDLLTQLSFANATATATETATLVVTCGVGENFIVSTDHSELLDISCPYYGGPSPGMNVNRQAAFRTHLPLTGVPLTFGASFSRMMKK
jgi:hypothetical protein